MPPDLGLPAWVGNVGPAAGIALTVVLAMVRGYLLPAREVDKRAAEWRERLAETRAELAIWRGIALERNAQITELIRLAQTTERVVSALPPAVDVGQGEQT